MAPWYYLMIHSFAILLQLTVIPLPSRPPGDPPTPCVPPRSLSRRCNEGLQKKAEKLNQYFPIILLYSSQSVRFNIKLFNKIFLPLKGRPPLLTLPAFCFSTSRCVVIASARDNRFFGIKEGSVVYGPTSFVLGSSVQWCLINLRMFPPLNVYPQLYCSVNIAESWSDCIIYF